MESKYSGLNQQEIKERILSQKQNLVVQRHTRTYAQIIKDNAFTLFNAVNLVLAVLVATTRSYKNMLFLGVVFSNLLIGIFQEIRAKRTLDKLSLQNASTFCAIRNGTIQHIPISEIVLDDIGILHAGDYISCDAILLEGSIEVNESALNGESDPIAKDCDDLVYSGSYVLSGKAIVKIVHVGKDNYIETILEDARRYEKHPSSLRDALDTIIRFCVIGLLPLGIALFVKQFYFSDVSYENVVLSTAAALVGMIPEGLILLTSIALAVGALHLARRRTLVQELYCIETLARVDVLCLDKTGTLTKGEMQVETLISDDPSHCQRILASMMQASSDDNATAKAIRSYTQNLSTQDIVTETLAFSSERKYSAARIQDDYYYLGASSAILNNLSDALIKQQSAYMSQGKRVLVLAKSSLHWNTYDRNGQFLAFIILNDPLREEASEILHYFRSQSVDLKLISGDDVQTASAAAQEAQLADTIKSINCSACSEEELIAQCEDTQIFGRVSAKQKKLIIQTLKQHGHTVAMLGDGVNDVMALKEADCSIAMGAGSDAARQIANLILLDNDFSNMPHIVYEGRRVINNIQRSASLFLVKTIFSFLLTVLTLFLFTSYPFEPIQLTLISTCTIGVPGFLLALQPSKERISGKFITNVLKRSVPSALCVCLSILCAYIFLSILQYPMALLTEMAFFLTAICTFTSLYYCAQPFNRIRMMIFASMLISFLTAILLAPEFFNLSVMPLPATIFCLISLMMIPMIIGYIQKQLMKKL